MEVFNIDNSSTLFVEDNLKASFIFNSILPFFLAKVTLLIAFANSTSSNVVYTKKYFL